MGQRAEVHRDFDRLGDQKRLVILLEAADPQILDDEPAGEQADGEAADGEVALEVVGARAFGDAAHAGTEVDGERGDKRHGQQNGREHERPARSSGPATARRTGAGAARARPPAAAVWSGSGVSGGACSLIR